MIRFGYRNIRIEVHCLVCSILIAIDGEGRERVGEAIKGCAERLNIERQFLFLSSFDLLNAVSDSEISGRLE